MTPYHADTICALATAPGRGSVGIVRVSGPKSQEIAEKILGFEPKVRFAHYTDFSVKGTTLDQGIALFFRAPNSFTGEDIIEFQGHGGPIVMDMLLAEVQKHGARLARPGEFSERAFFNDKLDLTQAEAIADLIDASSRQAAKQAINSLQGGFSKRINSIVDALIELRIYVESAIDFPEEEIDFLADGKVADMLNAIIERTDETLHQAQQGVMLREGMNVVIAGRPNAGKSSLLNRIADDDLAIVTDIAGTTRDVLRQQVHIDGLPLHIIDTAGLRDSPDIVEQIGIERAWKEIDRADHILLLIDTTSKDQLDVAKHWPEFINSDKHNTKLTVIYNKIDVSSFKVDKKTDIFGEIALSALDGTGIEELKTHLKSVIGFEGTSEGSFSARRRHISAIELAKQSMLEGKLQLQQASAGELLAEDLRVAQQHLAEVTGSFTSDDLLGKIFSSFCIGK